jgi:hypothetical protein
MLFPAWVCRSESGQGDARVQTVEINCAMKKRVRSDSRAEDEVYHAIAESAVEMIHSIDAIEIVQS